MSHEKTLEDEWGAVDTALEPRDRGPWEEMTDRERAEKIEEMRENTPEKDLRLKALEDRDMVEFSDISEEDLNPDSYSQMKEYGLELLDPEAKGAERKLEQERKEVRELKEHHEKRADLYNSIGSTARNSRLPAALGSLITMPASVGFAATGDPLLGGVAAIPTGTFFGSIPVEGLAKKMEKKHRRHGNYVRTEEFDEEAYPLFDAADVVIASKDEGRDLFQDEAVESYRILNDEAELVHAAEIEDYNPGDEPYAVDLRVDAHPVAGGETTEEPAEEVQYVLVGGQELEEAYTDLTWD